MKKNNKRNVKRMKKYAEFLLFSGESGYGRVISETRELICIQCGKNKVLLDYNDLAKLEIIKKAV